MRSVSSCKINEIERLDKETGVLYTNSLCKHKRNKLIGYVTETSEARLINRRGLTATNDGPPGGIHVPLYL